MPYTKLDAGLPDSTIWQAPDTTRIVWVTMLAMADMNGYIGASVPGLAGRARVSLDACVAALETFMAPDKWSRTKDFDGRRIAEADGGWVLLNHDKYREKQNAADRRERSRQAMAALRAKRKAKAAKPLTVNEVNASDRKLSQAASSTAPTSNETEEREKEAAEMLQRSLESQGFTPTKAGEACIAIRKAGIAAVNPGHPDLVRLLAAGVTPQELGDTAAELVQRNKGKFALLLATVEGRLRDAAAAGAVPVAAADPMAWRKTSDGVFGMGERLGVKPGSDEVFHAYERRVLTAFQRAGQAQEAA